MTAQPTRTASAGDGEHPEIGRGLWRARQQAELTLQEVAVELGVSAATWSAVKNGRTRISDARRDAAARLLRVTRTFLLPPWRPPGAHGIGSVRQADPTRDQAH